MQQTSGGVFLNIVLLGFRYSRSRTNYGGLHFGHSSAYLILGELVHWGLLSTRHRSEGLNGAFMDIFRRNLEVQLSTIITASHAQSPELVIKQRRRQNKKKQEWEKGLFKLSCLEDNRPSSCTSLASLREVCYERPYIVQRILYSFLSIYVDRTEQEVAALSDASFIKPELAWGSVRETLVLPQVGDQRDSDNSLITPSILAFAFYLARSSRTMKHEALQKSKSIQKKKSTKRIPRRGGFCDLRVQARVKQVEWVILVCAVVAVSHHSVSSTSTIIERPLKDHGTSESSAVSCIEE
ncbi:hypothetical protein N7493_006624 [Penicillium malachiteum]|uniref:Uncharacterized protein n=1 Tax=Penicillium malachiteum TaxID=1324776 RepID=A0AAD6HKZ5_9EURO|nr:hypothetical protein N7493_006624 [Penicillium malachiteum]